MKQRNQFTNPGIKRTLLSLLFLFPMILYAQTSQVTGVVTDAVTGEPLIGVSVIEKGTMNGLVTDIGGNFSINVPMNSILTFSYVGYNVQDVQVTSTVLNVRLKESSLDLDEVVVVGYGVQKKINLTGAVTSVKSDDLLKANSANATNALVGQMPGLIAKQATGEPGNDNSSLYIRGIATFQGGTQPTFIIDGIERTQDDFARIDANEIESVNVLKDAASAAIFGMRGANGVIVVTTKRGKAAKPSIRYSGNVSVQSPTSLPKFANSYDYARLYNEYTGREVYTPEEIQKFRDGSDPLRYPDTDWYDEMLTQNAIQTQHNVSVTGGGDNLSYFVSLGCMDQGGLWENIDYERYNLRSNLDAKITSTTKLSVDISGRIENTDGGIQGSEGIFQQLIRNTPVLLAKFPDGKFAVPDATHPNILALADPSSGYNKRRNFSVLTRVELSQDLSMVAPGLMVKGIMSYDHRSYRNKTWSVSPYIYSLENDGEYLLKERSSPSLSTANGERKAQEYQAQLTYERTFGSHSVSGLLMAMARKEDYNELSGARTSFDSELLDQMNAGNTANQTLNGYDYKTARISYVGRINYNYMQKYLAEVNVRRDGSENFAPDKRWGTFASFSLGWVISEEQFFENLKESINFLKLRGSYGSLGNDNTGGVSFPFYSRFDLYSTGATHSGFKAHNLGDYIFGEIATKGLAPGPIANKLATWETAKKSNVALDFGLFNKFTMSVDLFLENRSNILAQRSSEVPGSFGGTLPLENIGKVQNKGIDMMATYSDRIGKVQYSIGGNFTFARNKIVEMAEAAGTSDQMRRTGRPINGIYGYKTDGIFQSVEEINRYAKQEIAGTAYQTQPGDIKYVNVNGDDVVNADDMTYLGIGNIPEIIYGINGSVSWNRFDLSFLFQGAARTQVALSGGVIMPYFNQGNLPQLWVEESWSESNRDARYPRLAESAHNFTGETVDTYVYDASYLRLKNIEIGYNIPTHILSKIKIEALRVYVSGQNLLTFTGVPQIDPENTHGQGWTYPQMKSFNFGLNLQF